MIARALLVSALLLALSATPASAACYGQPDFWACRARELEQDMRDLDREQRESNRAYEERARERREERRWQESEEAREQHERRQEQQTGEIIRQLDMLRRQR